MSEPIPRNDVLFREANERIRAKAEEYGVDIAVPFICECSDPTCLELVRLPLDEYRAIREHPARFFNVPGHEVHAPALLVMEGESYRVVENDGRKEAT